MNTARIWTRLAGTVLALGVCISVAKADWTLHPTDDTMISMGDPNWIGCSLPYMNVRNWDGYGSYPDNWESDALIRFDLSSIAPGTPISSATLCLYYFKYWDNNPEGRALTCYKIDHDWKECTTNYNTHTSFGTQPGHVFEVTSTSLVPPTYRWMTWDVTGDVQQFVNHPETNFGWEIMDEQPWGGYNIPNTYFRTKEYGGEYVPYLAVVPEPGALALLGVGALALMRRRLG